MQICKHILKYRPTNFGWQYCYYITHVTTFH